MDLGAVGVPAHPAVVPPAGELRAADGELADEVRQLAVGRLPADLQRRIATASRAFASQSA
ncbi:MAG TPA: hypothetical protein VGP05_03325 [Pseudonocardia sp.]|nr:hypothetical protein [Pseudonocardia sp.]